MDNRSLADDNLVRLEELKSCGANLLSKKRMIIANKIDDEFAHENPRISNKFTKSTP
jgi:GTPase involved in cell partitioning and DNA repair